MWSFPLFCQKSYTGFAKLHVAVFALLINLPTSMECKHPIVFWTTWLVLLQEVLLLTLTSLTKNSTRICKNIEKMYGKKWFNQNWHIILNTILLRYRYLLLLYSRKIISINKRVVLFQFLIYLRIVQHLNSENANKHYKTHQYTIFKHKVRLFHEWPFPTLILKTHEKRRKIIQAVVTVYIISLVSTAIRWSSCSSWSYLRCRKYFVEPVNYVNFR